MTSISFHSIPESTPEVSVAPDPEPNKVGAESSYQDIKPIEVLENEGSDVLLTALGITDEINNIPSEDREYHNEVKEYVMKIIDKKGLTPTQTTFNSVLNGLKEDMGLSQESDPSVVLQRIGGVINAWKNVSFIKSPEEKRSIFMKLGKANSNEEMNRIVFEAWERAKIWQ